VRSLAARLDAIEHSIRRLEATVLLHFRGKG
jgi:hypothetical protein